MYTLVRSFNFTNVRKNNITGKKLKLWSIENFDLSYSYTRTRIIIIPLPLKMN